MQEQQKTRAELMGMEGWQMRHIADWFGVNRSNMRWEDHSPEAYRGRVPYSTLNDALREVMAERGVVPEKKDPSQQKPRLVWNPAVVIIHAQDIWDRYQTKMSALGFEVGTMPGPMSRLDPDVQSLLFAVMENTEQLMGLLSRLLESDSQNSAVQRRLGL